MYPELVEPSGAILLGGRYRRTLKLVEIDPEGNPVPGFGTDGVAKVRVPDVVTYLSPAAVDPRGRILLAGFVRSLISAPEKGQPRHSSFVVARLLPDGRVDHSFGRHGWLFTHLPGRRELISTQATLDSRGRLLIAGMVTRPRHHDAAFTVARYLLGP